jgi:membrane protein implicated in regulation of membrane protease activity
MVILGMTLTSYRRKDMVGIVFGILLLIVGTILGDGWVIGAGIGCVIVGALVEAAR